MTSTLNDELAMAAGIDPRVERLVLSVALAVVVALAIRVVGSLLISALLIVPAAAARGLAPTPERMVGKLAPRHAGRTFDRCGGGGFLCPESGFSSLLGQFCYSLAWATSISEPFTARCVGQYATVHMDPRGI